ncbi:MAG: hypothetical protein MH472_12145, partial [Bacteroidia bacterium]|nr:hypothetical protein [Bacteroidia bacterium]
QVSCAIADLVVIGYFVFAQNVFILLQVDASSCDHWVRHQNVISNGKKIRYEATEYKSSHSNESHLNVSVNEVVVCTAS